MGVEIKSGDSGVMTGWNGVISGDIGVTIGGWCKERCLWSNDW